MKKVLNIILALILGLSMVACDSMLKDSLTAGSGWGDVILNETDVTIDSALSITAGALDIENAVVSIDNKTGTIGTTIKNILSGEKSFSVEIPSLDGKTYYLGSSSVIVKAGDIASATVTLDSFRSATNAYKVILTEATFNSTFKAGDASAIIYSDINKVTLAGGMNGWSNTSGAYTLSKQADDSWVGYFPLTSGVEFKFIVSTTASPNTWTGGSNNVAQETAGIIEKEMTWRITLTESVFNSTFKAGDASAIIYSDINKVTLAGGINGWSNTSGAYTLGKQADDSWVGYFPLTSGVEFKFIVSTTASPNTWTGGSNNVAQETTGIITQSF